MKTPMWLTPILALALAGPCRAETPKPDDEDRLTEGEAEKAPKTFTEKQEAFDKEIAGILTGLTMADAIQALKDADYKFKTYSGQDDKDKPMPGNVLAYIVVQTHITLGRFVLTYHCWLEVKNGHVTGVTKHPHVDIWEGNPNRLREDKK